MYLAGILYRIGKDYHELKLADELQTQLNVADLKLAKEFIKFLKSQS